MTLLNTLQETRRLNKQYSRGNVRCGGVDINLTGNCTYDCLFCECQQLDPKQDLTTSELFDLARQMAEEGIRDVFFGGGEPLLRPDLPELIRHFSGQGIKIGMITNGSLPARLDGEMVALIDRCVSTISVSVDSADPARYNEVRNSNRAYDLALDTLGRLSGLKSCRKVITSVICTKTVAGLPGLVDIASRFRFDSVVFQPISHGTNYPELEAKREKADLLLPPGGLEELKTVLLATKDSAAAKGIGTNINRLMPWVFSYFRNHASNEKFYNNLIRDFRCIVAFSRINIRHNGDVQLCALVPGAGNIRQQGLRELLSARSEVKEGLRNGLLQKQCRHCFCGIDANLSFSMTYKPVANLGYFFPLAVKRVARSVAPF